MNTLFNACFCLSGPPVIVKEGDDAILPCSVYDKRNIESMPFNWKKVGPAGQKVIFLYDPGNDGRTSQDEQFRGRVSHFSDKLKNGNASITIKNTKSTDNGKYICSFSDRNLPVFLHVGEFHHKILDYSLIKLATQSECASDRSPQDCSHICTVILAFFVNETETFPGACWSFTSLHIKNMRCP